MQAPQALPSRFPCWCKAIYSWGGETKRDLGFIEGDLIECLNAGDGSWWMGRLKRDRRMVGLFPSNFVRVLDESFQPSRNPSPRTSRTPSLNSSPVKASPQKAKSVFRKPFQAYAATGSPNSTTTPRSKQGSPSPVKSALKHRPYSSMKRAAPATVTPSPTPPGPTPQQPLSRSPAPPLSGILQTRSVSPPPPPPNHQIYRSRTPVSQIPSPQYSRPVSPAPLFDGRPLSRATSPLPQSNYAYQSRGSSPAPFTEAGASTPPPAPPPHRSTYHEDTISSQDVYHPSENGGEYNHYYHTPRSYSSVLSVPEHTGYTPSPLRDAMEDVMSSLNDMEHIGRTASTAAERRSPLPSIWSPEAFGEVYEPSPRATRPRIPVGIGLRDEMDDEELEVHTEQIGGYHQRHNGPPQLSNFVERMERRLQSVQQASERSLAASPPPSTNHRPYALRPQSSFEAAEMQFGTMDPLRSLNGRKSAHELGRGPLGRTFTTKSSVTTASSTAQSTSTNSSSSTQMTSQSIMSGYSAGGFSATSAGSLARRKFGMGGGSFRGPSRPASVLDTRPNNLKFANDSRTSLAYDRSEMACTGPSYRSSQHGSRPGTASSETDWTAMQYQSDGGLGGLAAPKAKKSGFFKKMLQSAKTSAASARSTISTNTNPGRSRPSTPGHGNSSTPMPGFGGSTIHGPQAAFSSAAEDMGLGGGRVGGGGGGIDWMQVRRDVNRSNSLSRNERTERADRCQMLDIAVINPVDVLHEIAEGGEGSDGLPIVPEDAADFAALNLSMVDKNARFISNIPLGMAPQSLAQGYVCRPYRSDVQRLRAIFTWVAERIAWEEDFEGEVDTRRVLQMKRGCAQEVAVLVVEMCAAVGLHAEIVRGYLKLPGEALDLDSVARPNHWWNAVIVDGEWRIMDASLASPTNPKRGLYSSVGSNVAEQWWFLALPTEICYTHVPLLPEQQHVVPSLPHEVLMALPCACPPYFRHGLQMVDFDNSLLHLENLEQAHIKFDVPDDVECVAEVQAKAYTVDADGDFFESGDTVVKRALAQVDWVSGRKRYTVKALLPGDEGQGILRVYAGKKGLMHSIKSNPHSLAFALPIHHTGQNPPYDFVIRYPTPHASRHDLYIVQPQCYRLAVQNTFVFAVRQHPSSLSSSSPSFTAEHNDMGMSRPSSAMGIKRPMSAMSMVSATTSFSGTSSNPSQQGSFPSVSSNSNNAPTGLQVQQKEKPAKLAIQSPSGKILRLTRKSETSTGRGASSEEQSMGTTWETIIKIGESGLWRGLVLADRSARWCVFAEWECL